MMDEIDYPKYEYYLGLYGSDSMESRKDCSALVLFGHRATTKTNADFEWKWRPLPCPTCNFTHMFKRVSWISEAMLPIGYE